MTDLFEVLEATWPPASSTVIGPFRRRDGAGGGKRVSATVLEGSFSDAALDALGSEPLFQIRPGQVAFDRALERRGYRVVDPTILLVAPAADLAEPPPRVFLLGCFPPLAIMRNLWAAAHTGPERIAVMERVQGARQAFIIRHNDSPAGVGFVAIHGGTAMLHALHVEPNFRRQGVARKAVRAMAHWALQNGASRFSLAVTEGNAAARALYADLGMVEAGAYHYREITP